MAINFLDSIDLNGNQLLNARLQNLGTGPAGASEGDIIYNTSANKVQYWNGTTWVTVPDGSGIGGSGTVGTIPVFNGTAELTDSRLVTSGSGTTQTFLFDTDGTVTLKGSLEVDKGGIIDSNGTKGTSGQLLSSTGTLISWINAPVSYTKWIADGGSSTTQDVYDGDTYKPEESTTRPGILAEAVTKSGTVITQPLALFTKNMSLTSPSDYATDVMLWGDNAGSSGWKVQKTKFTDVTISTWAAAEADVSFDGFKLTSLGNPSASTDAANKAYVDANAGDTYTLDARGVAANAIALDLDASSGTDSSVSFSTASDNNVAIVRVSATSVTLGLQDDISLSGEVETDTLTVGSTSSFGDNLSMEGNKITNLLNPTNTSDAVNKAYVDSAVVGNLVFQGGYDAANNTPDLDSSPSSNIKKGWAYVVTAAGNFFTETVEVGDFLFAQSDAPTTLADWVTVQNNIGIATTTTPGIASFAAASFDVSAAGQVTLDDTGVTAATYGSGSAVSKVAINVKGQVIAAVNEPIAITHTAVTDFDTEVDARITAREFAGNNSGSGTSHVFTHSLGTNDVIVQIVDTSTLETVFAKVDRTSTSAVTVTTASSISAGAIRALITKIG